MKILGRCNTLILMMDLKGGECDEQVENGDDSCV